MMKLAAFWLSSMKVIYTETLVKEEEGGGKKTQCLRLKDSLSRRFETSLCVINSCGAKSHMDRCPALTEPHEWTM